MRNSEWEKLQIVNIGSEWNRRQDKDTTAMNLVQSSQKLNVPVSHKCRRSKYLLDQSLHI